MTDLDEMKKILGIQVIRDHEAGTLKIVQSSYIDKILTWLQPVPKTLSDALFFFFFGNARC